METVTIGNTTIPVEIVKTPEARERGLSGRESLPPGSGMLFVFEEEGSLGIWMKDMLFPIDIIWADQEGTIITIAAHISPDSYPEVFYPTVPAQYVLEVPAGFVEEQNIAEGMQLQQN